MAVVIKRSLFSKEDKEKINKDLTVIAEEGKDEFLKTKIMQFYSVDNENAILPLYYAVNTFDQTNDDLPFVRPEITFKGELRDYQQTIVDKALQQLGEERGCTIVATPGAGKTLTSIYLSCKLKCSTCILLNRTTLMDQWKESIINFTNGTVFLVGEDDESNLTKTIKVKIDDKVTYRKKRIIPDFVICMNQRYEKIPEFVRKNIGLVIIDEAHRFCTPGSLGAILHFNPIYTISLTATPDRVDGAEKIIHHFSGKKYILYSENKSMQIVKVNTPFHFSRKKNKAGKVDWTTIANEMHNNPDRNKILVNLIHRCVQQGDKIMVISGREKHPKKVCEVLTKNGIQCDFLTGKKKGYKDSQVLVGTIDKTGEGFDEATFCKDYNGKRINVIIIFNSFKSIVRLQQCIGRSRDQFPTVYHFVDSDTIIYRQWLGLRKYYLSSSCKVRAELTDMSWNQIPNELSWPYNQEGDLVSEKDKIDEANEVDEVDEVDDEDEEQTDISGRRVRYDSLGSDDDI